MQGRGTSGFCELRKKTGGAMVWIAPPLVIC
jgi:hypothetical protein